MNLIFRLHEKLAERFRWVQFPHPRQAHAPLIRWRYAMPLGQRFYLVGVYGLLLILGTVLMAAVVLVISLFIYGLTA